MIKRISIFTLLFLLGLVTQAENILPYANSVVFTNMVCGAITGNLFSQEGIPDSIEVPTIIIQGKGTRFEITDENQLEIEKNSGRYYSILLLDGACLWIKDGVSPKCNVFTVGKDYPWRSKDSNGDWKDGYAPGVIAFEGYGEIVTGCNKDSGEYPLCYLFLRNGIIKFRQMDATEGKSGDSLWGWVADRAFFHPSYEHFNSDYNYKPCDEWEMNGYYAWPDSIKYELRRGTVGDDEWNENNDSSDNKWPNQTQFWLLNNIELHCTKWWSRGIGTDQMRLESNNHLPVIRISNNWDVNDAWDEDVTERTTYEWRGDSKYAADNSNWIRDWWTPEYEELTAGKYYLFADNSGEAGKDVSFNKVEDDWTTMTVGLRDSFEIRNEFNFSKDDDEYFQFIGTWLQACNETNTVTLPNGLELVNDMEIYTGRGLTVEGTEWDFDYRTPTKLPAFSNAVTELDVRIVGGGHLPALAKYEDGTLRFIGDTKDGHAGNDLWKLKIGEGLVEIGTNVTVSCYETVLAPDLKERTDRSQLALELYFTPGATLETRNVTTDFPWGEMAACKLVSTNGLLRLTGVGENIIFKEATNSAAANVTFKLGTMNDAMPSLTLDVTNPESTYVFNTTTHMEGDGIIRKVGPGGIKFESAMIANLPKNVDGKPEIGFEVSEGWVDFDGENLGECVSGSGEIRNATIAIKSHRDNANNIPVCGDGVIISSVTLMELPSSITDYIVLAKFKKAQNATNFYNSCMTENVISGGENFSLENLELSIENDGEISIVKCTKMPFTETTDMSEIANELAVCTDGEKLSLNIRDATEYAKFREWANAVDGGQKAVAQSQTAWYSYALAQDALLTQPPQEVKIEDLEVTSVESGTSLSIVVAIKDIPIGVGASAANLAKVFGVLGSQSLDVAFLAENVSVTDVSRIDGGKAKITFGPSTANAEAKSFFIKVKIK